MKPARRGGIDNRYHSGAPDIGATAYSKGSQIYLERALLS